MHCEGQILDFVCGWELEAPQCPSGYHCWLIHATGEFVCCPEEEDGWRRRKRRNGNKKVSGKTGKIYVRAKWPITPAFVPGFSIAWSDKEYLYFPLGGMLVCRGVTDQHERVANQVFDNNKKNTVTLTGLKQQESPLQTHCISEPCFLFSFQSSVTLLSRVEEFHCC